MPASKHPGMETLRALMAEHGTATAVARVLGLPKGTVCRWLREAGSPAPHYSPYTVGKTECPFSADRLREMYWRERMSMAEIGEAASSLTGMDKPIDRKSVALWLERAGIARKARREYQNQLDAAAQERRRSASRRNIQVALACTRTAKQTFASAHIRRKGVRAAAVKKRTEGWETRDCARPDCQNTTTRRKSEFRRAPEQTYCSRRCSNLARYDR